jgi:Tol biopolymer transport system component
LRSAVTRRPPSGQTSKCRQCLCSRQNQNCDGGPPAKLFDIRIRAGQQDFQWTTDSRALIYIDTRDEVSNLWQQPIEGGEPKQLTDFKTDLIFSFDYSRDGKQLVLSRGTYSRDVVLISNFR